MGPTIVLDSNIWLAEQMLMQGAGSAFRFYLRKHGARVAVPEVVRLEVVEDLGTDLRKRASDMRASYRRLLAICGTLRELVLPTNDEIDRAVAGSFEKCNIELLEIPFSFESARASFLKCVSGEPPCAKGDQQFKDGVLWSDCLRLAASGPVTLITSDTAFYHERNYQKGLARNLAAEATAASCEVKAAHCLTSVLEQLQVELDVDHAALSSELARVGGRVSELARREGFEVGALGRTHHKVFATEQPSQAHLEFELEYFCSSPDGRTGLLKAQGEGIYDPATGLVSGVRDRGGEFVFQTADGEQRRGAVVLGVGAAVLGHRSIDHQIRVPVGVSRVVADA